ncbi:MAG: hypothetical protein EON56_02655, partial [Alphaproteobacteria bacterium]
MSDSLEEFEGFLPDAAPPKPKKRRPVPAAVAHEHAAQRLAPDGASSASAAPRPEETPRTLQVNRS